MFRYVLLAVLLVVMFCSPICAQKNSVSSSEAVSGSIEIGIYDKDGDLVPFNTKFEVKDGLIGWCMDDCPGLLGDVTVNTSDVPVSLGVSVWEPGLIFVNSGLEGIDVVVRYQADSAMDANLAASVTGESNTDNSYSYKIKKMNTELTSGVIDCLSVSASDSISGVARNIVKNASKNTANIRKSIKLNKDEYIDFVVSPYDKKKLCGRVQIYFEVSDSKGSSGVMKLGAGSKSVKRFVSAMDAQIKREKTRISRQKDDNVKSALAIEERAR